MQNDTLSELLTLLVEDEAQRNYVYNWAIRGPLSVKRASSGRRKDGSMVSLLNCVPPQLQAETQSLAQRVISRSSRGSEIIKLLVGLADKENNPPPTVISPNYLLEERPASKLVVEEPVRVYTPELVDDSNHRDCIRSLVFCFQGIDSPFLSFSSSSSFQLTDSACEQLPQHLQLSLRRLSEMGTLYKNLHRLANSIPPGGCFGAFKTAVSKELADYQAMTVVLDSKASTWNLLKLTAWSFVPLQRLRALARLVEKAVKLENGGQLLSFLAKEAKDRFPSLFTAAQEPWLGAQSLWINEGELSADFYVKERNYDSSSASEFWSRKFWIDRDAVPEFVDEKTASEVLLAGKQIRFERAFASTKSSMKVALERVTTIVQKYLLLGCGSFGQSVLDLGHEILARPAESVKKHELLWIVDSALRAVGAADADELLDARLGPASREERGWEVFGLDVRVEGAAGVVVTEQRMKELRRVSGLMWKVCRAEYVLSKEFLNKDGDKRVKNLVRQEMWHVAHSLRSYLSYDVVAAEWQSLLTSENDALSIERYELYVKRLLEGCFLSERSDEELEILNSLIEGMHRFVACQKHEAILEEIRLSFLEDMRRLIKLLEKPKKPEFVENLEDLHNGLLCKLNFNLYFSNI